jgi:SSS family solute:Na+ symporter
MLIAALWPLVIRDFPGLFSYIQQVFSYAVPPVAAIFLLGLFWRRMSGRAALWTLAFGHTLGAALLVWRLWAQQTGVDDGLPHFTIVAGLTTLACVLVATLVSLAQPGSAHDDMLWRRADGATQARGLADYRWQAAALVLCVAALIWVFR